MSELKSLANSEQFPAGVRVSIMREMMVRTYGEPIQMFVLAWNGHHFVSENGISFKHAAEIPAKKIRPMTAKECWSLPVGTLFFLSDGVKTYAHHYALRLNANEKNPNIAVSYLLPTDPDDMEPRRFEVDE